VVHIVRAVKDLAWIYAHCQLWGESSFVIYHSPRRLSRNHQLESLEVQLVWKQNLISILSTIRVFPRALSFLIWRIIEQPRLEDI